MPGAERDSTQDWLLPGHRLPPTIVKLEERIDEALATARATEAAVMTVGAAALDAAEQARRAAELAERAASTAAGVSAATQHDRGKSPAPSSEEPGGDSMRDFSERADRLVERLQQIQRVPLDRPSVQQHTRSHSTR
jgi:predicted HD phosphohydrolase